MNSQEFMSWLKDTIHQHPFLSNPLVTNLAETKQLSRQQAKRFALLYYPHILRTRLYQANALGITPDEDIQFALSEILYDEYGNGDPQRSHMAVYRKFMRALDISDEEIQNPPVIPELEMYIHTMMRLSQGQDWLAAVAAVGIASEWPIPAYYEKLLRGLKTIPGIQDDDLELFSSHIVLDIEHSQMMEDALMRYADNEHHRQQILRGVQLNLDARQVFLNGLYREVFESNDAVDTASVFSQAL
ncbi:MAG: iron-containing redox enzyme family protein [Thiohalophilus sp.]